MTIIERIKNTREYLKTSIEYARAGEVEAILPLSSEINSEGIIIKKSDRFVKHYKALYAMGAYTKFKDIHGNDVTILVVVTDNLYDKLSDNAKRFIILHERGHFFHQFDKIVLQKKYKRYLEYEFKADEFAIDELGTDKVIEALNELKNTVLMPEVSIEIRKRINNIMRKNR